MTYGLPTKLRIFGISIFSALLGIVLLGSSEAMASYSTTATNTFPNNAGSTQPLYMTIGTGEFENPLTSSIVTFDQTGSYNITINDADFCNRGAGAGIPRGLDLPTPNVNSEAFFRTYFIVGDYSGNTNLSAGGTRSEYLSNYTGSCAVVGGVTQNYATSHTISINVGPSAWSPIIKRYVVQLFGANANYYLNPNLTPWKYNPSYCTVNCNPNNPATFNWGIPTAAENSFSITVTGGPGGGNPRAYPPLPSTTYQGNVFPSSYNFSNRNRQSALDSFLDIAGACNLQAFTAHVSFWDVDSGVYQDVNSYPKLTYEVWGMPKSSPNQIDDNGNPLHQTGELVGGNNVVADPVLNILIQPNWVYRVKVYGLSTPNALSYTISTTPPNFDVGGVFADADCTTDNGNCSFAVPPPVSMVTGSVYTAVMTVTNTGTTTWTTPTFALGSQDPQDNGTWGTGRLQMPPGVTLLPNQSVNITHTFVAPAAGAANFYSWKLVHEGVAWFGSSGCRQAVSVINPYLYQPSLQTFNYAGHSQKFPPVLDLSQADGNYIPVGSGVQNQASGNGPAYTPTTYPTDGAGNPVGYPAWLHVQPGQVVSWPGQAGLGGFVSTAPTAFPTVFYVDLTTPNGSQLCLRTRVAPHSTADPAGSGYSNVLCWTIINPRFPYAVAQRGDVHAGAGAACSLPASGPGNITGQVSAGQGSFGEYVVSAAGAVNNFGSANSPGGNVLTLGNTPFNGLYGTVCRPNLIARVIDYITNYGQNQIAPPGGGLNLTNYDASTLPRRLLHVTGSTSINASVLTGTLANPGGRFTIYVEGNLTINGDLSYSPAAVSLANLPSLGIIVTGNVYIAPGVHNMVGAIYAVGTIDTCSPYNIATCDSTLSLDGSMYAKGFSFKRTGGGLSATGNAGPSEVVAASPRLYLAPPPGFADLAALSGNSQAPVEKPPLY
jgi:hypothetical protein